MTVVIIRPTSDVASGWFGPADPATHYDRVDNVVTYPTVGGTSDFIVEDGWIGSNNTIDTFHFGDLDDVDEVTKIKIYSLGGIYKQGATAYYPEVEWSVNGGLNWLGIQNCSGHYVSTSPTQQYAWHVTVIDGLHWTQAQINAIILRYTADTPGGDKDGADANFIAVIYIEVTYTEVLLGYEHDFLGVAAANISSVSGITSEHIGKIKGV
ncbi:MAG: hypothetical protein ACTSQK_02975 [Candidatus Heimdallarchaeota archaeon]